MDDLRRALVLKACVSVCQAEQLEMLESGDTEFEGLPALPQDATAPTDRTRFHVTCPICGDVSKSRGEYLGRNVTCPKCKADFLAEWSEPVTVAAPECL